MQFFIFLRILSFRLVHVFKNLKLLFENICKNTCGCKNALKYVKCDLKTEKCCLKTQTKHRLSILIVCVVYRPKNAPTENYKHKTILNTYLIPIFLNQ